MATKQRISAELARMAVTYRHPLDADELRALVSTWDELCSDLSDAEFIAACKAHMRKSSFFPCPANVLREHAERPVRTALPALPLEPEDKTPQLGCLVLAAFRGDPEAQAAIENMRQQPSRVTQ